MFRPIFCKIKEGARCARQIKVTDGIDWSWSPGGRRANKKYLARQAKQIMRCKAEPWCCAKPVIGQARNAKFPIFIFFEFKHKRRWWSAQGKPTPPSQPRLKRLQERLLRMFSCFSSNIFSKSKKLLKRTQKGAFWYFSDSEAIFFTPKRGDFLGQTWLFSSQSVPD